MNLLDFFDRAYVINLPERTDRRRAAAAELGRPDVGLTSRQIAEQVQFFPAIRPAEEAPFQSVGVKGCSLSHLAVLKDAMERGLSRVLVLEDDVTFARDFASRAAGILSELAERQWGIVQFGHAGGPRQSTDGTAQLIEFDGEVLCAHCYAVNRMALRPLVEHFEVQHRGIPGDHLRGPMPADGTLNVFRWLNPDIPRFVVVPSLAGQRSSRSDITPGRLDRLRVLRPALHLARALRTKIRSLQPRR